MYYPKTKGQAQVYQKKLDAQRTRREQSEKRRIEMGYLPYTKLMSNGGIMTHSPKGYVAYTTRELVIRVSHAMDSAEQARGVRECYINGSHRLQIRGKHLRRLIKAMPGLRQEGRKLVQTR